MVFLIDASFTMQNETFSLDDHNFISRLQSVQKELIKTLQNLRENQSFNVIKYTNRCTCFKLGLVPASQDNVNEAISFVNEMLQLDDIQCADI